jgi:hypothetical protein
MKKPVVLAPVVASGIPPPEQTPHSYRDDRV